MTATLKITSVGNSAGVILPKEVLQKMRVEKGDSLFLTETPMGYSISPHDEEFALQMKLAEKIMREDRDVLRQLAQ